MRFCGAGRRLNHRVLADAALLDVEAIRPRADHHLARLVQYFRLQLVDASMDFVQLEACATDYPRGGVAEVHPHLVSGLQRRRQ